MDAVYLDLIFNTLQINISVFFIHTEKKRGKKMTEGKEREREKDE